MSYSFFFLWKEHTNAIFFFFVVFLLSSHAHVNILPTWINRLNYIFSLYRRKTFSYITTQIYHFLFIFFVVRILFYLFKSHATFAKRESRYCVLFGMVLKCCRTIFLAINRCKNRNEKYIQRKVYIGTYMPV